jgi:hypothetical protein
LGRFLAALLRKAARKSPGAPAFFVLRHRHPEHDTRLRRWAHAGAIGVTLVLAPLTLAGA